MKEKKEKRVIVPIVSVVHEEGDSGLRINVNMAGASKKSLNLDMGKEGFCVKGESRDFRYDTCQMLAHRVKAEEAEAKFESGLLTIRVPFDESMHGREVPIK